MITLIAAITRDRALGRDGDMIFHISEDLKRFKKLTTGHPLVMGRRTFESFPNGPLPGRRNLVVTRDAEYVRDGIETFTSLEAALEACGDSGAMVIGGGQIYAQAIPVADRLLITEIDTFAPDADTFFPEISPDEWELTEASDPLTDQKSRACFRYLTYKRKNKA